MFQFNVSEDERVSVDNLKRTADAIVERARKRRSLGGSLIAKETTADVEPQLNMYVVKCKVCMQNSIRSGIILIKCVSEGKRVERQSNLCIPTS